MTYQGRYRLNRAGVRKRLEKKGMHFATSAATVERDVDNEASVATVEAFAAIIRKG